MRFLKLEHVLVQRHCSHLGHRTAAESPELMSKEQAFQQYFKYHNLVLETVSCMPNY